MSVTRSAPALFGLLTLGLALPSLASPIPGVAPEEAWQLDGYVSYLGSVIDPDNGDALWDNLIHQRLNLEYRWDVGVRMNLGLRNRLTAGDSARLPGYGELLGWDPGYWDLSLNWLDRDGWVGNSQLDRAYLSWQVNADWQLSAGRFRVNWAMSTLWNPNDIFNAYSIYDVDYAERRGVDALRVNRRLGVASLLELVYSQSGEQNHYYAGRYLGHYSGWDWQIIAGKAAEDIVLGFGFAGDIAGAGFRGEYSHFEPQEELSVQSGPDVAPLGSVTHFSSSVATLELDYSFASEANWRVLGAALYISSPLSIDNAQLYLNLPLTARTLSFTPWTFYLETGLDLSPLSRLNGAVSYYDDGSYFYGVTYQYSLADDWQLSVIGQRFDGSPVSLFGQSASTLGYLQLKWSF
ncbi:hypothetical protein [Shewanella marisflavi]|uniref:hypothetical protein n=1 Tax=Shewanella marisflavi TaxID=260364 RepID=UPI003AABAE7D